MTLFRNLAKHPTHFKEKTSSLVVPPHPVVNFPVIPPLCSVPLWWYGPSGTRTRGVGQYFPVTADNEPGQMYIQTWGMMSRTASLVSLDAVRLDLWSDRHMLDIVVTQRHFLNLPMSMCIRNEFLYYWSTSADCDKSLLYQKRKKDPVFYYTTPFNGDL